MKKTKAKSNWSKKPVGIRSAYIGGIFIVIAAIISGVFLLGSTILGKQPTSVYPPPGISSSAVAQIPCTGKTESPEGMPGLDSKNSLFSDNIYRLDGIPSDGVAFPQVIQLSSDAQKSLAGQGWQRWLLNNQGYDVGSSAFDLTITAHRAFSILQMRAFVIQCAPSATGSVLEPPPTLGAEPIIGLQFELGSRNTAAFAANNPQVEYFHKNTFAVTPGKASVFQVTALANGGAFKWEIAVTVLTQNGIQTFLVGEYGKPFLTTDFPAKRQQYKAVYETCGDITIKACSGLPSSYWAKV